MIGWLFESTQGVLPLQIPLYLRLFETDIILNTRAAVYCHAQQTNFNMVDQNGLQRRIRVQNTYLRHSNVISFEKASFFFFDLQRNEMEIQVHEQGFSPCGTSVQYCGGCSVYLRDRISTMCGIPSHQQIAGCLVLQGVVVVLSPQY